MRHLIAEWKANILETMHLVVFPQLSLGPRGILPEPLGRDVPDQIQEECKALRRLGRAADPALWAICWGKSREKGSSKGKRSRAFLGSMPTRRNGEAAQGRHAFTAPALALPISFSSSLYGNSDGQTNSGPDTIPAALSDGRCSVAGQPHRHPALWVPGGPVATFPSLGSARRSGMPFQSARSPFHGRA